MKPLHTFHGGLKLPRHKTESLQQPIQSGPVPKLLVLPLAQPHTGQLLSLVHPGDQVLKGQKIAEAENARGAPLHAPTSGRVIAIELRPFVHASGLPALSIVLQADGQDTWIKRQAIAKDYLNYAPERLTKLIHDFGIVGLGGAAFPTSLKLERAQQTTIQTLIINAAECEPYISCDDALIRERAPEILAGIAILQYATQAQRVVIAIEKDMTQALAAIYKALEQTTATPPEIAVVPTLYPSGGERQLIEQLTGLEVPHGGLPMDLGVVCYNIATAYAVQRAVYEGEPLISRIVTVTGDAIRTPGNFEVLLGTSAHALFEHAGGYVLTPVHRFVGGPMMGYKITNAQIPITKSSNCLLALSADALPATKTAQPCIRCSACSDVCPARLLPQQLFWYAQAHAFDQTKKYHVFDCIECGCCDYVCPSHIPLVEYFRYAKHALWALDAKHHKALLARARFNARQARITQAQLELETRRQQKKAALVKRST